MSKSSQRIQFDAICADVRAQPRAAISVDKISEYVEDMQRGDEFPALVVFHEGEKYWLADGFHRYYAARTLQRPHFDCIVHKGELRDAILYSCGANATHGLRRTIQDKRRAVAKLFDDEAWAKWSDGEIAKQCAVSAEFVRKTRKFVETLTPNVGSEGERTYRTKHGTVAKMNTAAIGRREPPRELPPVEPKLIADAVREVKRLTERMPDPADAAARFPVDQRYLFPIKDLEHIAAWWALFAEAMQEQLIANAPKASA